MPQPETLHIITLGDEDNSHNLTPLLGLLQQHGERVSHVHISHPKELPSVLKHRPWELLLLTTLDPHIIKAVQQIVNRLRPEMAIMATLVAGDNAMDQRLFELGIQQLIDLTYPQRAAATLLRDVERIRLYKALQQSQLRLQLMGQQSQLQVNKDDHPILYLHRNRVIYANPTFIERFGFDLNGLLGEAIDHVVPASSQAPLDQLLKRHNQTPSITESLEIEFLCQDNSVLTTQIELSSAIYKGSVVQQLRLKTQQQSEGLIEQLRESNRRDHATGSYTRQYFIQNLTRWLSQRRPSGALLLIAPDQAQQVTAQLGNTTRDQMLQLLATALQQLMPDKQLLARYDDERMILLIMGGDPYSSEAIAAQITTQLVPAINFTPGGHTIPLSVSIGMTLLTSKSHDHLDLLSQLESTLSEAISHGGDCYKIYQPAQEELAVEEQVSRLAQEIKLSLQHNSLELFYQPIISLKGDPNENYEVLLRMPYDGGYISAIEFFDAANHAGLTIAVDRWVVGRAIQSLTARRRQGRLTRLFVKLSAATLEQVDPFINWLTHICQTAHLEPNSLIIEITEQIADTHIKSLHRLNQQLTAIHIPMALDNISSGSGYQQILRYCPVSYLKLSYQLVSQITTEQSARQLTEEITAFATQHQIKVIANAVEDAYTLSRTYAIGVDYILGYFFQAPKADMDFDFSTQL